MPESFKYGFSYTLPETLKNTAAFFPKASQAVLNRAVMRARTKIGRQLASESGLKVKDVTSKMSVVRAQLGNLTAILKFNRKRFAAILFATRKAPTTHREPITLKVGPQMKTADSKWFIQRGKKSGKLNIFTQPGESREKLSRMPGFASSQIFEAQRIGQMLNDQVGSEVAKELPRVVDAFMKTGKE